MIGQEDRKVLDDQIVRRVATARIDPKGVTRNAAPVPTHHHRRLLVTARDAKARPVAHRSARPLVQADPVALADLVVLVVLAALADHRPAVPVRNGCSNGPSALTQTATAS